MNKKVVIGVFGLMISTSLGATENIFQWENKQELPPLAQLKDLENTVRFMAEDTSVWKLGEVKKGIYDGDKKDLQSWGAKLDVYNVSIPYLEERIKSLNNILKYTKKSAENLEKVVNELKRQQK